jgi:hypothetical protein
VGVLQSAADFQISMLAGGKHTEITSRASPTTLIGRRSDKQEFTEFCFDYITI